MSTFSVVVLLLLFFLFFSVFVFSWHSSVWTDTMKQYQMTLPNRTVRQKNESGTDTIADTLTDGLGWLVLTLLVCSPHGWAMSPVCSPHGWAMSWCVLHTGGRCPSVFSARVGDVLVYSPHGWAMSWCVLHTGGRCPRRLYVTAVDICIIYCPPGQSVVVQTGHWPSQWPHILYPLAVHPCRCE